MAIRKSQEQIDLLKKQVEAQLQSMKIQFEKDFQKSVTEKTSEDAIKKINQRIDDLQKTQEKLLTMMQNLQNEATEISAKAQKLYEEQQK